MKIADGYSKVCVVKSCPASKLTPRVYLEVFLPWVDRVFSLARRIAPSQSREEVGGTVEGIFNFLCSSSKVYSLYLVYDVAFRETSLTPVYSFLLKQNHLHRTQMKCRFTVCITVFLHFAEFVSYCPVLQLNIVFTIRKVLSCFVAILLPTKVNN